MSMGSGDLKECPEKPPIVKFGFKVMSPSSYLVSIELSEYICLGHGQGP